MPDPAIIDRLRDDFRSFRSATTERAAVEDAEKQRYEKERHAAADAQAFARRDADAKRATAIKAAGTELTTVREQANRDFRAEMSIIDSYLTTARGGLAKDIGTPTWELQQLGLEDLMKTPVEPAVVREDADLGPQLSQYAATVKSESNEIRASGLVYGKWRLAREQRRARRRRLISCAAFILIVGCFLGGMLLLTEQRYQVVEHALATGDWQTARDAKTIKYLWLIPYKDSADFQGQSLYLPGLAALNDGRWDEARWNLGQTNYKDAADLYLESYYRPGIAAINANDWLRAQSEFKALTSRSANYKDTPQRYFDALTQGSSTATFEFPAPTSPPVGIRVEIASIKLSQGNPATYQLALNLRIVSDRNSGAGMPSAKSATVNIAGQSHQATGAIGIFNDRAGGNFNPKTGTLEGWPMSSNTATGTLIFDLPKAGGLADCLGFSYGDAFIIKQVCILGGNRIVASRDISTAVAEVMPDLPRDDRALQTLLWY